MDAMVLATQQWLNANFNGRTGYNIIPETGNTGWTTIYGLLHALQIELGISTTADNFGPTTVSRFNSIYPNGVQQQTDGSSEQKKIYGIIQGALWCKGYFTNSSTITMNFFDGTGSAVKELKEDAGFTNPDSTVTLNVMKALMSMSQYVLVVGGNPRIRVIQQRMNREYENYIGLAPCDGIYGRDMNKALIVILQSIEGYSPVDATGNFGQGTQSKLPLLPDTLCVLDQATENKAIDLVKYALICNEYSAGVEFGTYTWDNNIIDVVSKFQRDLMLPINGNVDKNTWMSLLLSKGNPERPCIGCDTSAEITIDRIPYLKQNNYQIVGRYLAMTQKGLKFEESRRLLDNELQFFPIYQGDGTSSHSYTLEYAEKDAYLAVRIARSLGIPESAIIYFAVDYDAQDTDITSILIPYFQTLLKYVDPDYKIGVYGTRNICTKIINSSSALTAFVSDMSTAYSGNMGFKMPENWNFDQFFEFSTQRPNEISLPYPNGWDLDRVAYSGKYPAVSYVNAPYQKPQKANINEKTSIQYFIMLFEYMEKYAVKYIREIKGENITDPKQITLLITGVLRYWKYNDIEWNTIFNSIDTVYMSYFASNYEQETGDNFALSYRHYLDSNDDAYLVTDGIEGLFDMAHFAATLEGCISSLVPSFWSGWGGDLASAMSNVTIQKIQNPNESEQDIADRLIGSDSGFNYSDLCCDADSLKIAELIKTSSDLEKPVSKAFKEYYNLYVSNRYEYFLKDVSAQYRTLTSISGSIHFKMAGSNPQASAIIALKGGIPYPTNEVISACCTTFAKYIYSEIE